MIVAQLAAAEPCAAAADELQSDGVARHTPCNGRLQTKSCVPER